MKTFPKHKGACNYRMTYKGAHKRTLEAHVCYKDKGEANQNDTPKDTNKNQTKVPKIINGVKPQK
jgi:hypothetical protein